MTQVFGGAWEASYGPADGGTAHAWCKALGDMTRTDLVTGINALVTWQSDFPPNLPQFRSLCKPPPKPAAHREYQTDPRPATDDDRKARFSAMLKAAMAGKGEKPLTMATENLTDEQRKRFAGMAVNGGSKLMRAHYRAVCTAHGIAAPTAKHKPTAPYQAEVWRKCALTAANPATREYYRALCKQRDIALQTTEAAIA